MRKTVLWLAFLLIISGSLVSQNLVHAEVAAQSSPYDLIAAVNALRIANGLPPYNSHPILMQIAQTHADYMAATGSVTHFGPNNERPFERALNAGYPVAGDLSLGGFFSENILAGQFTAEKAVEIWQGDAPHLTTMLSPNLQDVGAGVVKVGDFIYYVLDASTASNTSVKYTPNSPGGTPLTPDTAQFVVPVITSTPDENGMVYHEVQSGQSLWAIAIAYGTKIDEIRKLNNLPADAAIYPGDRLFVQKDATTPTSTVGSTTVQPSLTLFDTTPRPSLTIPVPVVEATQSPEQPPSNGGESASYVGVVVGIILLALLTAGIFTRVGAAN